MVRSKIKLSETQTAYRFTDQEGENAKAVLRDMAADIETICWDQL